MHEINLLKNYPRTKRNVAKRLIAKTPEHIKIAKQFGKVFFDGPREYGYGGYQYDGRWQPVAKDIIEHFNLQAGMKLLDIGCAKGFLIYDLMHACPGLQAYGIDISDYAINNCLPQVANNVQIGCAENLPFANNSFDAVISINTIHNLSKNKCKIAIQEIERVAPGKGYIQVDSYFTTQQKQLFLDWVLTAEYHDTPQGWKNLFKAAGYTGYFYWTITE